MSTEVLAAWDAAEAAGLVRMRCEPEDENYFDVYGEPETAEERAELCEAIERDGLWWYCAEYLDHHTGQWERADSIGMIMGELSDDDYGADLKRSALQQTFWVD